MKSTDNPNTILLPDGNFLVVTGYTDEDGVNFVRGDVIDAQGDIVSVCQELKQAIDITGYFPKDILPPGVVESHINLYEGIAGKITVALKNENLTLDTVLGFLKECILFFDAYVGGVGRGEHITEVWFYPKHPG